MKSMLLRVLFLSVGLWLALSPAATVLAAQGGESPQVEVQFLAATGVGWEQLASGAVGEGWLVYYLRDGDPDRPRLAVRLVRESGADAAWAYVYAAPPDGDRPPVTIDGGGVQVEGSAAPVVEMQALGGWWVRDGIANYNLEIQINGPVVAMWGASYSVRGGMVGWPTEVEVGEAAVHISARDLDGDGIPDWDHRVLLPEFPGRGYVRGNYAERKCDTPTEIDPGVSPLWPYVAFSGLYQQPNGGLRPPIVPDWQTGRIIYFSEMVAVRNQNCSYAFYPLTPLLAGQWNRTDNESPFAFYDLSGQGVGYPNLILRTVRAYAGDPWMVTAKRDYEFIRYSWQNDVGDWHWDYKVEVLGNYPYDFETPIAGGDTLVDAPPYDEFPAWVVERSWPVVTFVDTEGTGYRSGEGIYEWSAGDVGLGYYLGYLDTYSAGAYVRIGAGLRGEYRLTRDQPPLMYLSPVDNRLHLKWAEGGTWRPGEEQEVIRAENTDGDEYIDVWSREVPPLVEEDEHEDPTGPPDDTVAEPEVIEALFALGNHLLYGSQGRVAWVEADYQPGLFETLPPTDHDTWEAHRSQLAPYEDLRRDPRDLRSWLDAFPGPRGEIFGATLAHARATGDGGFRFELSLQPGYRLEGTAGTELEGLAPGDYLVTYQEEFSVRPLTAAQVELVPDSLELEPATPLVLQPMNVSLKLHNSGLADLLELPVKVYAGLAGADPYLIAEEVVDVLGGETVSLAFPWTAPRAGDWRLEFVWDEDAAADLTAEGSRAAVGLEVQAQPPLRIGRILQLSNVAHPLPLLTLLGALGLSAAALAVILIRPGGGRR